MGYAAKLGGASNSIPAINIQTTGGGKASNSQGAWTSISFTETGLNQIYKYGKVTSHSAGNGWVSSPNYALNYQYVLNVDLTYFRVYVLSNGSSYMSITMESQYYN